MKAWLEGHEFDLDDLVELLPSGETRVVKDGDGYYLMSPEMDVRPEGVPFYEVASQVLQRVNGLARAKNPRYRPVRLTGRYQDGQRRHTVVAAGTAEARARVHAVAVVTDSAGVPNPLPLAPGPGYVSLAARHPEVAEALALMGQAEPFGWGEMWKVYEIIRENVKPATVEGLTWVTPTEHSAFRASANRPDVSGPGARHARMSGEPPKHKMDEAEGRQFVSKLMIAWLESLNRATT